MEEVTVANSPSSIHGQLEALAAILKSLVDEKKAKKAATKAIDDLLESFDAGPAAPEYKTRFRLGVGTIVNRVLPDYQEE